MCDYSLAGVPNRLAAEGEELIVHRFSTGSVGLTPPQDLIPAATAAHEGHRNFFQRMNSFFKNFTCTPKATAVCVAPGAHLLLQKIPDDLQRRWAVNSEEDAVFVQIGALENSFRDAVRFFHGRQVLLQELPTGMRVKVLSLGDAESVEGADQLRQRIASVR